MVKNLRFVIHGPDQALWNILTHAPIKSNSLNRIILPFSIRPVLSCAVRLKLAKEPFVKSAEPFRIESDSAELTDREQTYPRELFL